MKTGVGGFVGIASKRPATASGCGGAGPSTASPLLPDALWHRLRRGSWHPTPRRSQRRLTPFFSSLLEDVREVGQTAHDSVARWSRLAAESSADLRDVATREARELGPFLRRLTPESSVFRRDLPGGTSPRRVRAAIARARKRLGRRAEP